MTKKLSVISLGWMGRSVYNHFYDKYECSGSFNDKAKDFNNEFHFNINNFKDTPREITESDIVFFNLPPSKIENLNTLDSFFKSLKGKRIILVSSTSVYEGTGLFDESSQLLEVSKRAQKQIAIERSLIKNHDNYTILRCAGLYGRDRHPGLYLSGKSGVPKPNTSINLIGIEDILSVLDKIILESEISLLNLVNSSHPTKKKYYNDFCLKRGIGVIGFDDDLDIKSKVIVTMHEEFKINSKLP